jgi:hypothetical protein
MSQNSLMNATSSKYLVPSSDFANLALLLPMADLAIIRLASNATVVLNHVLKELPQVNRALNSTYC